MSQSPVLATLERLMEVRRRRRWSQAEMAAYLAVTEEAYRALEKGRTIRLEWKTILRLWDVLENSGLCLHWLFGRPGSIVATGAPAAIADEDSPVVGILDRLTDIRRRRNWSQAEMAGYLAVTEEAYRALEKGRTIRLEWKTIVRLWDVIENSGLSMHWLLGRPVVPRPAVAAAPEPGRQPLPEPVAVSPQKRRKRGFRLAGLDVPAVKVN